MLTGMATLDEVADACAPRARRMGTMLDDITLLQCTTEYPTPPDDVNLLAMCTMGREFEVATGDRITRGVCRFRSRQQLSALPSSKSTSRSIARFRASDHAASMEPEEFAAMVGGASTSSERLGMV